MQVSELLRVPVKQLGESRTVACPAKDPDPS